MEEKGEKKGVGTTEMTAVIFPKVKTPRLGWAASSRRADSGRVSFPRIERGSRRRRPRRFDSGCQLGAIHIQQPRLAVRTYELRDDCMPTRETEREVRMETPFDGKRGARRN